MSSYMDALQRDFPAAAGVDRGPFEAWRIVADLYGHPVYFSARETWLRECAYVFWDLARIDPPGIRDVIRDPYTKVNSYTDQEWEDMNDSFRERSDLWARSGAATEYFKQGVCWYTRPIREY